ncbi:hypothetical protein [Caballeronia sp. RCC_10]|uniref:hypothetical protein n=1 Tax=Caballeronia sp. RCC_10 TaxID=3239227 RepID=UPI0035243488
MLKSDDRSLLSGRRAVREIGTLAAATPGASAPSTAIVGTDEDKPPLRIRVSGRNSQICFIRFDAVPNHLLREERRLRPAASP